VGTTPKEDYRMNSLTNNSIKKFLKTETLGVAIYCFDEIGSTNEIAFELGKKGAPEGTVVISDSQTRGRGRLRRKWISPPGLNLYMSVIFRPGIPLKDASLLTLISSVAVVECIKVEGGVALIKWPNDVLINGKKVSGILTETEAQGDRVDFVIVGIGVNLNMTAEIMQREREIADTATSLRVRAGARG
jgi:birA, biotin-[acetyl-CoA-carboxylase] ligase region